MFVGSTIGGFIPKLWGASFFSLSSLILSVIGGFIGIWIGFKIGKLFYKKSYEAGLEQKAHGAIQY